MKALIITTVSIAIASTIAFIISALCIIWMPEDILYLKVLLTSAVIILLCALTAKIFDDETTN